MLKFTAVLGVPLSVGLSVFVASIGVALAAPPSSSGREPGELTAVVPLQTALRFALENNPTLATQRKQRGIAAARIVIADTYPFNPILENRVQGAVGPESAGITNRVPVEHLLLWEMEVRNQRQYRRQGAAAALSRTEWEIAFQEQTLSVDVTRAYMLLIYRQEKLRLLEETLRLNERLVEDVRKLVALGKLRAADLIVAQTEVADTLDLVAAGREAVVAARQDLNKALGIVEGRFAIEGLLEPPPWKWDADAAALGDLALTRRADLRAKQMLVAEMAANVRLTVANRSGNPVVGTVFALDPSRVSALGVQVNVPLPVANLHRGEIRQSEAEQVQAAFQWKQAEFAVKQDVAAAFARLAAAEQRVEQSRNRGLPTLTQAVQDMEKLFQAGEPGVDVLRVIDVRRKLLRARDSSLDALWSVRQAMIDVAAATGEPFLQPCGPVTP